MDYTTGSVGLIPSQLPHLQIGRMQTNDWSSHFTHRVLSWETNDKVHLPTCYSFCANEKSI